MPTISFRDLAQQIRQAFSALNIDPDGYSRSEYVINAAEKTVKLDSTLLRQIVYVFLSAYTPDPINLAIIGPSGAGKTHPVMQVLPFVPEEDVLVIGSMTPKALVRQEGVEVDDSSTTAADGDSSYKIKDPEVMFLQEMQKRYLASFSSKPPRLDEQKKGEDTSGNKIKTVIDLSGKTLVFVEPPDKRIWPVLKPILSHDKREISHSYVENTDGSPRTKTVIVRGWPACIFCAAQDQSGWRGWSEVVSRFMPASPNMSEEKYHESNRLTAAMMGLPKSVQQKLIISDGEVDLAKKCFLLEKHIIQRMCSQANNDSSNSSNNPVWVPFWDILGDVLPSKRAADPRRATRLFAILRIIALAKSEHRPKLVCGATEASVIATLEDLEEALSITQNLSGSVAPFKMEFFNEVFMPCYYSKNAPDGSEDRRREETRIAVTTSQLCQQYKKAKGIEIGSNNLKQTYLNELINNDIIAEESSQIDRRQKLYYPLLADLPQHHHYHHHDEAALQSGDDGGNAAAAASLGGVGRKYSRLNLPTDCRKPPEDWLNLAVAQMICILGDRGQFQIQDSRGKDLCICQFVAGYEQDRKLAQYFVRRKPAANYNRIFSNVQKIKKPDIVSQ